MTQLRMEQLSSSFAEHYVMKVEQIQILKTNRLFIIDANEQKYVIKLFDHADLLYWQSICLEQLEEKGAKGIIPFCINFQGSYVNKLNDTNYFYGVLPYVRGNSLRLDHYPEVKNGISLLGHFHRYGKGIMGKKQIIPYHSKWLEKLKSRFELFSGSVQALEQARHADGLLALLQQFEQDTRTWAEWVINYIPHSQLLFLERNAQLERQVVHLDVAPHNFLIAKQDSYYLMDYDLVQYSPVILDITQYIHRALMYYGWSVDVAMDLVTEYQKQQPLQERDWLLLPYLLIYPHDILREWLGVWKHQSGFQVKSTIHLFQQLEGTWEERRKFVRACQAMVK